MPFEHSLVSLLNKGTAHREENGLLGGFYVRCSQEVGRCFWNTPHGVKCQGDPLSVLRVTCVKEVWVPLEYVTEGLDLWVSEKGQGHIGPSWYEIEQASRGSWHRN